MENKSVLVVINSAIAGGKTQLIKLIREKLPEIAGMKIHIIDERVDLAENIGGDTIPLGSSCTDLTRSSSDFQSLEKPRKGFNLLDAFYKNMPRWSYTFQFFMFITRVRNTIEIMHRHGPGIYIMERDWFADRICFAETLHNNGCMNEAEWFTYEQFFDWLCSIEEMPKINAYIFIKCSLETHMKRMRIRNRSEETGVSNEYEQALIDKHEIMEKDYRSRGIPVLSLDGEVNYKDDEVGMKKVLDEITFFVKEIVHS